MPEPPLILIIVLVPKIHSYSSQPPSKFMTGFITTSFYKSKGYSTILIIAVCLHSAQKISEWQHFHL